MNIAAQVKAAADKAEILAGDFLALARRDPNLTNTEAIMAVGIVLAYVCAAIQSERGKAAMLGTLAVIAEGAPGAAASLLASGAVR